jgi:hypothetical protein
VNAKAHGAPPANPFSTRAVRPGAIPYIFSDGQSAAALVDRLAQLDWRAQIVGPHGSGKSTLLASLMPEIEAAGRRVCVCTLRDGMRRMPQGWHKEARQRGADLIIVDGYEQLSYLDRWLLRMRCRLSSCGLLVTAHDDVGLATLATTEPSVELCLVLVNKLLPIGQSTIDRATVEACYTRSDGNLRDTLFALYDRYEEAVTRK